MKYLILSFLLLTVLHSYPQSAVPVIDTVKKGLSESELNRAKELYTQMTQTATYIHLKKKMSAFNEKLNRVDIGPSAEQKMVMLNQKEPGKALDSLYRKRLTDNLSKTEFKSVEEGMAGLGELKDLERKKQEENAELYSLRKRASQVQLREILEIESAAMRARGY